MPRMKRPSKPAPPRSSVRAKARPKAASARGRKVAGKPMAARKTAPARKKNAARAAKWVYQFGGGGAEGRAAMRDLLGGKGANLAEMARLGLPVPPGFTITTRVCVDFCANGKKYPKELEKQVARALDRIAAITGKRFGDADNPLLLSVRSGARASMPGMMDTVLNLGLNDVTVEGLAAKTGNPRFAYDSYRRFIQMYSDVVLELDHGAFEEALEIAKEDQGYHLDTELTAADWKALVGE
ncbi:MAG: pyruvate, phosphate dikinase, partial [Proteobacteria bacterium]|nr:pyruvate, phosphate dikinase [Pseudomonadota bacterium]